jgi:hypothetical protein
VLLAGHLCEVLFLFGASALIVRSLFTARTLTFDGVLGAVCGYLFLGLGWAVLYSLAEGFRPGSFAVGPRLATGGEPARPERVSFRGRPRPGRWSSGCSDAVLWLFGRGRDGVPTGPGTCRSFGPFPVLHLGPLRGSPSLTAPLHGAVAPLSLQQCDLDPQRLLQLLRPGLPWLLRRLRQPRRDPVQGQARVIVEAGSLAHGSYHVAHFPVVKTGHRFQGGGRLVEHPDEGAAHGDVAQVAKTHQEVLPGPGQGLRLATAATARGCETLPATEKICGGYFFNPLFGKASAWTTGQRDRELMILELSCQVFFSR